MRESEEPVECGRADRQRARMELQHRNYVHINDSHEAQHSLHSCIEHDAKPNFLKISKLHTQAENILYRNATLKFHKHSWRHHKLMTTGT